MRHDAACYLGEMSEQPKKTYWFKRPDKKRRSFALYAKLTTGVRSSDPAPHPEVEEINAEYKSGRLSLSDATLRMTLLREKLNRAERASFIPDMKNAGNIDLFNKYWEENYAAKRNRGKQSHWYAFQHVLQNLGTVSILGDPATVLRCIEENNPSRNEQRRYLSKVNTLRKEHGKKPIPLPDRASYPCRYLTEPEFLKVLPHVKVEKYRELFQVLFYTGVRTGEALTITPDTVSDRRINITGQVVRENTFETRKNSDDFDGYEAIALPNGEEALKAWARRTDKSINRTNTARVLKRACKKVFPNDPSKWLTAHDLRHCFCVYMLTVKRYNDTTVAKLIGDTPEMVRKHYGRFIRNSDFINGILADTARG